MSFGDSRVKVENNVNCQNKVKTKKTVVNQHLQKERYQEREQINIYRRERRVEGKVKNCFNARTKKKAEKRRRRRRIIFQLDSKNVTEFIKVKLRDN